MKKLLSALCLLMPMAAYAAVNLATVPIGRTDLPWWKHRFERSLAEAKADPNAEVIWLGDSITQYWQRQGTHGYDDVAPVWNRYYAPYHALNFGFIGDTTASLIWRLDHGQVAGLHPKLAIILIGANNLGRVHWAADQSVPGIETVVSLTHRRLPNSHILLLGVLPSIRSPWVDQQTRLINAALARRYANDPLVTFENVGPLLLKNGHADPSLYVDPRLTPPEPALHPDAEGMTRIARALAPIVAKYTGQN
jgi:lysophospholipase L1-like esterase